VKIETREEIINALVEAAELEHGLMAQYLYAAMTLKDQNDGLTANQALKVKMWKDSILDVARQEMGHLGTALNLLEAVGGASHLDRERFPAPTRFYTPPIPFSLEPLTGETIERFVHFELPEHVVALMGEIEPAPVIFAHVGKLYSDIKDAITRFNETDLFIGRQSGQDTGIWSTKMQVLPVTNRKTAQDAIDSIIKEGEGNPTGGDNSHFGRFKKIQNQYEAEVAADGNFVPHRNVLSNPSTREPPHAAPGTNKITVENTAAVAKLFNACYTTLLLFLVKYYRFEESEDNQAALQNIAKPLMKFVLAPLGELLSRLPANRYKRAGPTFEIYTLAALPNDRAASLKVLRERIRLAKRFATKLAAKVPDAGVIEQVAGKLDDFLHVMPA
jgi:Ferritin-like